MEKKETIFGKDSFVLKGQIVDTDDNQQLIVKADSYVICEDGKSQGVFSQIPSRYEELPVIDYKDALIFPGFTDLHVHASQYGLRGVGYDCELIQWLNKHVFPIESQFSDLEYARKSYEIFVEDLKKSATCRAVIFGTIHVESTLLLMNMLEETGLVTYVGKINMDRNAPDYYVESNASASIEDSLKFISQSEVYERTHPIITPRFIPSCSDELMSRLAHIKKEYKLPMQSHLSENPEEVAWVQELSPESDNYGDAYLKSGILEGKGTSILAHCIYSDSAEQEILRETDTYVAHCPSSNLNLVSGIAPIRAYMNQGIHVGLGSDVSGGDSLSIWNEMVKAIQVSKMYTRYIDSQMKPLEIGDVLYLATRGGGAFFGKVGSFDKGYDFDAIVMSDENVKSNVPLSLEDRVERCIYQSEKCKMLAKYVDGKKIEI